MKRCKLSLHVMNWIRFFALWSLVVALFSCDCGTEPRSDNGPDTTSHDFTWLTDTLGYDGFLSDATVIDDNNIWAVGEIYLEDTTNGGPAQGIRGLARFDGAKWSLETVLYHDFGSSDLCPGRLNAVQSFGLNDVYVASYANLLHWNGNTWTEDAFFMTEIPFVGQVTAMWGTSGTDLYCVGYTGAIYYFNGNSWQKQQSETNARLTDVRGSSQGDILACGWESNGSESVLLRYQPGTWKALWMKSHPDYSRPYSGALTSLWGSGLKNYWIVGSDGVYLGSGDFAVSLGVNLGNFPRRVRGNAPNDVFIVGDNAMIMHWNGKSWHEYTGLLNPQDRLLGLAVNPTTVVAVGFRIRGITDVALVIVGKRIQ
jgi:hypothetical protein